MMYTIRETSIRRSNRKPVPVFQVRDEAGRVYCNESSLKLAEAHIDRLCEADKRNEQAQKDQAAREKK